MRPRPVTRRNRPAPRSPTPAIPAQNSAQPRPSVTTPNHRDEHASQKPPGSRAPPGRSGTRTPAGVSTPAKQFRIQPRIEGRGGLPLVETAVRHDQFLSTAIGRAGHGKWLVPTARDGAVKSVGWAKGALAAVPTIFDPDAGLKWWARHRTRFASVCLCPPYDSIFNFSAACAAKYVNTPSAPARLKASRLSHHRALAVDPAVAGGGRDHRVFRRTPDRQRSAIAKSVLDPPPQCPDTACRA